MFCQIIPDSLLKEVGDEKSLKLSKLLRKNRAGLLAWVKDLVKNKASQAIQGRDRNTHDCQNKTDLPGKLVLSEKSPLSTSDFTSNEAHLGAAKVYDFYFQMFNRNSLDDKGMTLISSVRYDKDYNNAYWDGKQICYGEGDGKIFVSLTKDLSVIAHELTHGVISNTSNLNYYGQSGALNESYADKMGIACEHWAKGQFDPKEANWLLGDEIIGSEFPGKALRSFKNEKAYSGDGQPKHMKKYKWTIEDNGGVHYNSGIFNHAFYLYCLSIGEASYGKPAQIAYNAMIKLGSMSNFKAAAKMEYKVALELYGQEIANKVKQSYLEVGIKI